jgi:hypothetical protein
MTIEAHHGKLQGGECARLLDLPYRALRPPNLFVSWIPASAGMTSDLRSCEGICEENFILATVPELSISAGGVDGSPGAQRLV